MPEMLPAEAVATRDRGERMAREILVGLRDDPELEAETPPGPGSCGFQGSGRVLHDPAEGVRRRRVPA